MPIVADYTDDFVEHIREEAAGSLLESAWLLWRTTKEGLSESYPPASVPGQYPHGRTWGGRDGLKVTPDNIKDIARLGYVRVGFLQTAFNQSNGFNYMVFLELHGQRLGLFSTYEQLKPAISRLLAGTGLTSTATVSKPA